MRKLNEDPFSHEEIRHIIKQIATGLDYVHNHGFFHRDVLMPNGDKEKKSIEIDSLKNASKYAEQDLKDRWEWYKERYIKKLNKK